jgi:hypothetical protein
MKDQGGGPSDLLAGPMLTVIRDAIADAAGSSLVGLYVYGSLATGDFEPAVSDIDLIAVLTDVPDDALIARLREMHVGLARVDPAWRGRIEVDYVAAEGLSRCRTDPTSIARIGPGEPLHLLQAGRDFLLDWYPARQEGISLVGPPIGSLIPPIPEEEYLREVRAYLGGLLHRFTGDSSPGSQAYAILTMCRGVCALTTGRRLSKRQAATQVRLEFPMWAGLIDRALGWRDAQWRSEQGDGSATVAETRSFLAEMTRRLDLPAPGSDAE